MQPKESSERILRRGAVAIFCLIFIALIAWGTWLARKQMLSNARELGTRLAHSQASEAAARLNSFELFLGYGASGMNDLIDAGADAETMQSWLEGYRSGMFSALGDVDIDPYAVVNGKLMGVTSREYADTIPFESSSWYTNALESPGVVYATGVYCSRVTLEPIITLSISLEGRGNVLVLDIPLDSLSDVASMGDASDGIGYLVFDQNGYPVLVDGAIDRDDDGFDAFVQRLHAVDSGSEELSVEGPDGENLSVFSIVSESGWLSVVTIPTMSLLLNRISPGYIVLLVACLVSLAVAVVTMLRERKSARAARETEETIRILGNTYFAIYRVNYLEETYVTIKSSPDTAEVIGPSGTYRHFMEVIRAVVDRETFDRFSESFSCQSIRAREMEGMVEFGGRYLRRFPNGYRWVSVSSITNDEIGNGEAILCFRSVEGAMRAEIRRQELLESALDTARQATESQRMFFSNVSHDMRTPLNAIVNLVHLIRRDRADSGKCEHYLELLEEAGNQLATLVDDVLDVSHIQASSQSILEIAPVDLVACARTSVELAKPRAEAEHKVVELHSAWPERRVLADERRLGQIFNNLISNSLKYSHEGARVDVTLGPGQSDRAGDARVGVYRIEVVDTGIGMTDEFVERIFEPFARETMFAPEGTVGTGLGMVIVKSLVQQMGGDIVVKSKLGIGSSFVITVPFENVDPNPAQVVGPKKEAQAEGFSGRRVLVAEDNETNRMILEAMLQSLGIEVVCVENGAEAVEKVRDAEPYGFDAVLMDMNMPVMDGCTAARSIRELTRSDAETVPIIAVTANAFAEDITAARTAGMTGYVSKPIDPSALVAALSDAWSRN